MLTKVEFRWIKNRLLKVSNPWYLIWICVLLDNNNNNKKRFKSCIQCIPSWVTWWWSPQGQFCPPWCGCRWAVRLVIPLWRALPSASPLLTNGCSCSPERRKQTVWVFISYDVNHATKKSLEEKGTVGLDKKKKKFILTPKLYLSRRPLETGWIFLSRKPGRGLCLCTEWKEPLFTAAIQTKHATVEARAANTH